MNRRFLLAYLLPLVGPALLLSGCSESSRPDTLILADGSIRTGHLERCTAELCVLGGREVPQATILYIGLGADMPPPSPRDPTRDEVHLTDKSIHPGPLRLVDADTVFAATNHVRKRVAWIWLTPTDVPPVAQPSPGDRVSGAAGGCDRSEVLLYDVLVSGEKSGSETSQGSEGEFSFSYVYSARYARVPVTLKHECETGDIQVSGPTDSDPHPGTATLTSYVWRDSITGKETVPTDSNIFNLRGNGKVAELRDTHVACRFNVAIDGLDAQIEIDGYVSGSGGAPGRRSGLSLYSRARSGEDRHGALISARHKEECNKRAYNISVFDGLALHDFDARTQLYEKPAQVAGVSLDPPALNFLGRFSIDGLEVPATLRDLVRGDSFSVSSGRRTWQKTYEGTNKQERASAATSMTVTFSRAR